MKSIGKAGPCNCAMAALLVFAIFVPHTAAAGHEQFVKAWAAQYSPLQRVHRQAADMRFYLRLAESAQAQTRIPTLYDPRYFSVPYPNGDVPADRGVCSDVIIRAYRSMNVDLQKLVHEDMKKNFRDYPQLWGLRGTDTNIDHRRVPNLMTFFSRRGRTLPLSMKGEDYRVGDVVAWDLGSGVTHIGIVLSSGEHQPLVVHNIGAGPQSEPVLFRWPLIGVFEYRPPGDN